MSITLEENISLSKYSTFRMGGVADFFAEITTEDELVEALAVASSRGLAVTVLGGGSNTLIKDEGVRGLVLRIAIQGSTMVSDDKDTALVTFGAGVVWDSAVEFTVSKNLSGLEALSAIPGSVGGTPVQNVGAYGQEVKNVIESVRVYDREQEKFVELSNIECEFAYRDSMFKHEGKNRYIITTVTFKLLHSSPVAPNYPGVSAYFTENNITEPTLIQIREAITEIRKKKLPDPREIASVGSFFKNPFVTEEKAVSLKEKFPKAVLFPVGEGKVKVGAGWLIDTLGWKGKEFGNLMLYPHNALVIVNKGGATYGELIELVQKIQVAIRDEFGIEIEPEPVVL